MLNFLAHMKGSMTAKYNALEYSLWLFHLPYYNPAACFRPFDNYFEYHLCTSRIHSFIPLA